MSIFGFHTGPGGNRNGIGDHWQSLDAAALPSFLKAVDDYGPCYDLARIAAASGVAHTVIFRLSTAGQNDGYDYDVPNYNLAPSDAAALHWQKTKAKLPANFDKARVWVEPINEVDKNRSDWLGWFAVDLATIANREGYKVTLFGWSSGEPEPQHWNTAGMLAYLDYCATRGNAAAISVHEYSYDKNKMVEAYPHMIGRFTNIINTCAAHNIPYPTIHITEWGWEYNNVPDVNTAMIHIAWANSIYAPYPNAKGLAIWYLGAGFGDIANQAQRLIAPVTTFNLNNNEPGEPDPPSPQPLIIQNAGFEVDWATVSNHDAMRITDGGIEVIQVGNIFTPPGWMTWFRHHEGELAQPEVRDARSRNPDRMRSGIKGQLLFTFYRKHDAGFWQKVIVGSGKRVRFTAYAHAWSSQNDNPRWSEGTGEQPFFAIEGTVPPEPKQTHDDLINFRFQVGIDPTGGTNPFASTVIWGAAAHIYNAFAAVPHVEVTTQANTITLFLRSRTAWAFKHNDAYWDDCILELIEEPDPPTPPVNYKVVAHLTPQTLTRAEYDVIANEAVPLKQSVVFSADDAARLVAPGLPGSKVVAWWQERWQDDIVAWLKAKGVKIVETRPQSPPAPDFSLSSPVQGIALSITDPFNSPRNYNPPYHEGTDFRAVNANGQPANIVAAAAGTVDGIRRTDPGNGYGLYVRTRHVVGATTYYVWYGHLGSIAAALSVGQTVVKGQLLGVAGNSGNSTGVHLHLTVQKVPGGLSGYIVDSVVDPAPLLGLPASTLPGPGTPPTPIGNAGIGLHAPADPVFTQGDFNEFDALRPNWIKVLSSHSFEDVNRLAAAHPTASFIIRAFLSFWENGKPRNISPSQFVNDTKSDVMRAVNAIAAAGNGQLVVIELHNEPNLYQEGLGGAWTDGPSFNQWYISVLDAYRILLPQVKFAFPGLSPGGSVAGIRLDSTTFMAGCLVAAARSDFLGIHAYWNSTTAPLPTALNVVDGYITQVPNKPILVTEASNNQSGNADVMATDYVTFWQELRKRPRVQGVTYFVCNASNPDFGPELWTPRHLGAKVRARIG